MYLQLFKNARELWDHVKSGIKEKEASLTLTTQIGYSKIESLQELQEVVFPVVVKTTTDYESAIPTHHVILRKQAVDSIKREIVDEVLTPYYDLLKKKSQ